ncbi:MAG: NAD(P)/FAD-dependent oxidoreductase [Moorellales bacterium]
MQTRSWEVAVVGGGPAGAAAAWHLAREGRAVVVLEKAPLPRYKACGGGLTRKAWRLLPADPAEVVEDEVREMVFFFGRAEPLVVRPREPVAYLVRRERFDHWLLEAARAAGAEIVAQSRVVALEPAPAGVKLRSADGRSFFARLAIAADGAFSRSARDLGIFLPLHRGVALEVEQLREETEMIAYRSRVYIDFGTIRQGYAWLFPKAGQLSLGVGSFRVVGGKRLLAALSSFCRQQGIEGGKLRLRRTHPLPVLTREPSAWHGPRGLAAGDAAGLVDPLTGEGLYYALKSGRWAAEAAAQYLRGEAGALEGYSRRLKTEIWPELAAAWRLAHAVYLSPGLAYQWLRRHPDVVGRLSPVLTGETTYRELLRELSAKTPASLAGLITRLRPGA